MNEVFLPMKLIVCNKITGFKVFLVVFLLAGLMVNFQNYEPGKNVKTCDITSIVPVAAARFIQSKTPRLMKGENIGAF